ncbi:MAG: T9SS type A sorting domain-containing protein [Flavobacteriales bacterium]|nr:T9SS type A sorting domain-containing protein [Flavobacteriales bacterium]
MQKIVLIFSILLSVNWQYAQCYKQIAIGGDHAIAIGPNNELIGWGRNMFAIGSPIPFPESQPSPIVLNNTSNWVKIWAQGIMTFAVKDDNTMWAMGTNNFGALGIGQSGSTSTLMQVSTNANWVKLSSYNNHTIGIRADGTIWTWGSNQDGEVALGPGMPPQIYSPTQVGTANHWVDVATTTTASLAVRNDGTVWGAGVALGPLLGQGPDPTNVLRQANYSVGGSQQHSNIAKIKGGASFILAQKTDGTLVAWGANEFGELAMPLTYFGGSTPQSIGTDTWLDFAVGREHVLAIKTDGTLWAWGRNQYGQLGLGHTNNVNVPTQVGTANDWVQVQAGGIANSMGIKADGSVWVWGRNNYGQFGNGTTTQSTVPLQNTAICVQTLSTPTYTKPTLSIAPNPAKDYLQLNYTKTQDAHINIYDVQGRVVYQNTVKDFEGHITIPVHQWQKGLYMVHIQNNEGESITKKVLVH